MSAYESKNAPQNNFDASEMWCCCVRCVRYDMTSRTQASRYWVILGVSPSAGRWWREQSSEGYSFTLKSPKMAGWCWIPGSSSLGPESMGSLHMSLFALDLCSLTWLYQPTLLIWVNPSGGNVAKACPSRTRSSHPHWKFRTLWGKGELWLQFSLRDCFHYE